VFSPQAREASVVSFMQKIRLLGRDKRGLSTVEYTILLVLIVSGTVTAWNEFGTKLSEKVTKGKNDFISYGN
jgi:Flp pilus assembly pilin Flp